MQRLEGQQEDGCSAWKASKRTDAAQKKAAPWKVRRREAFGSRLEQPGCASDVAMHALLNIRLNLSSV